MDNKAGGQEGKEEGYTSPCVSLTPASPAARWIIWTLLILILVLAFYLRVAGLHWGLPNVQHLYSYHPDEIPILGSVLHLDIFTGKLNPHFFNYGTFYTYLVYFSYLLAMGLGLVHTGPGIPLWELLAQLHLVGRSVTVVFGVATVLLTYTLARRVTNPWGALLAAFLITVVPGHVANSHYATVDVTLTFWVTLTLLLMTRIASPEDRRWVLWSGLVTGLATGTKYSVALLAVLLLFVCWRAGRSQSVYAKSHMMLLALLAMLVGFLIACPYAVLAFPEFKRDVLFEWHHSRTGSGLIFQGTGYGWWYHAFVNFPYAAGVPLKIFLIVYGLGMPFLDRSRRISRSILGWWVVLFFVFLGSSHLRFLRYLLPLLPALSVLLADAIMAAITRRTLAMLTPENLRAQRFLFPVQALLSVFVFASVTVFGWLTSRQFVLLDTRDAAISWLRPQLPIGSTVGLVSVPWFYTPPLSPFNGGLKSRRRFEAWNATAPYKIVVTGWDGKKLEATKPDYFVISEFEMRDEVRLKMREPLEFLQQLSQRYLLVKTFRSKQLRPLLAPRFVPHDWLYPHPEIRIYRRRM